MAGAVEPVPAQVPLAGHLAVDRVGVRGGGQRVEEARVEHRDVGQAGQQLAGHADPAQVGGVVEGGQQFELLDVRLHRGGDLDRRVEGRPAVDDPVADRLDTQVGGVHPELARQLEDAGESGRVVREPGLDGALLCRGPGQGAAAHCERADGLPDSLDQRPRQLGPGGGPGVDDLQLERGGPGVDDEHAGHDRPSPAAAATPCAWTAVMATVLTMSSTSAPRERSLMGLRSPCRTGPIATAPAVRCTAL